MAEELRPLSVRRAGETTIAAYDALHEGVPRFLWTSLHDWIKAFFVGNYSVENGASARLRMLERYLRRPIAGYAELLSEARDDVDLSLDVVDALLTRTNPSYADVEDLEGMLRQAGSAWRVMRYPGGPYHLARRVDETMTTMASEAISRDRRESRHLASAWTKAWGREPNASDAYGEAVKAVEAVLAPIVSPADPKPTLGTMIGNIRDAPKKFAMRLDAATDPVQAFLEQLRLLWGNQIDRHGTSVEDAPFNVSIEQAQDAVGLATLIVHWTQTGAFTRKA